MRWERLFGELEGQVEHAHLEERDALVAELREGEWAARSWLDGLQDTEDDVELYVEGVGLVVGQVRLANSHLVHLESPTADHVVSSTAVRWIQGAGRSAGVAPESVRARLGWGYILREAHADADEIQVVLAGGQTLASSIEAVGQDFVRLVTVNGRRRDVPFSGIVMITIVRLG